MENTKSLAIIK